MIDYINEFKHIIRDLVLEGKLKESDYCVYFESLKKHTSFKVGGDGFFFVPKTEIALQTVYSEIIKNKIKYFVLGNGSNTLFPDKNYDGIIILISEFNEISFDGEQVFAGSSFNLTKLSKLCSDNSLTGFEFAYGIPGSVGGAVFMNAGAYGGEIKDVITEVKFLNSNGEFEVFNTDKMELGYRTSVFQDKEGIIVSAKFQLKKGKKSEILLTMKDFMDRRKEKQPLEYPSAGSTFKRLPNRFTAKLIEDNGLKGYRVGGAMVSEKHAGFIINYDNATSSDILELIKIIQNNIYQTEGELIQTEIRIIE